MANESGKLPGVQQNATPCNIENRVQAVLSLSRSASNRLTPAQRTAIERLLHGESDARVAERLHLDRSTVYRWRTAHPTFRRELERLRKIVWAQQADRLRAMVQPALDVLEKQLENPTTALRAATVLLRFAAPRADALAEPVHPEKAQRDERRALNRALDAYINAPMPDGTRGVDVHVGDDDDDEDLDDDDA
jgi:hypothetical protein